MVQPEKVVRAPAATKHVTTMAAEGGNAPECPTRGILPRADASDRWAMTPRASGYNFGDVEGVYGPLKIISACSGGRRPSSEVDGEGHKALCVALGGDFCRRRLWSAIVAMVVVDR